MFVYNKFKIYKRLDLLEKDLDSTFLMQPKSQQL